MTVEHSGVVVRSRGHDRYPDCHRCSLCESAISVFVPPRGKVPCDILVVGEAPGADEDRAGKCWVGPSGRLLTSLLREARSNLPVDDKPKVGFTNVVKCIPRDERGKIKKPGKEAVEACRVYLEAELIKFNPKVILALGATAIKELTGQSAVKKVRGMVLPCIRPGVSADVIPSWHPAYILRGGGRSGAAAKSDLVADIHRAFNIAAGVDEEDDRDYRVLNDPRSLKEWTDEVISLYEGKKVKYIAVDLETEGLYPWKPNARLFSIQVAWSPGKVAFIPVHHSDSGFLNPKKAKVLVKCVRRLLETVPVAGQNFRFDYHWLRVKLGVKVKRFVFDTMLAGHCLSGGIESVALDHLAGRYLGRYGHKDEMREALKALPEESRTMGNVPLDVLVRYGCDDADVTYRLVGVLRSELKKAGRLGAYKTLYLRPWRFLLDMEYRGLLMDMDRMNDVRKQLLERKQAAYDVIVKSKYMKAWRKVVRKPNPRRYRKTTRGITDFREVVIDGEPMVENLEVPKWLVPDFNPGSHIHVKALLYDVMGCDLVKWDKTKGQLVQSSAQEDVQKLAESAYEEGDMDALVVMRDGILRWRAADTLLGKFADKFIEFVFNQGEESGLPTAKWEDHPLPYTVHPTLNQHVVVTGRLSADSPPIHGTPWKSPIKSAFVSQFGEDGVLVHADYSQMELRVMALLSRDPGFVGIYRGDEEFAEYGGDLHRFAASRAWGVRADDVTADQRNAAKAISFGIIYGSGVRNLADTVGVPVERMEEFMEAYFDAFSGVKAWIEGQHEKALRHKYVMSPTGRYLPLVGLLKEDRRESEVAEALRQSVNYPIQGAASDICLLSSAYLWKVFRQSGIAAHPFAIVHDAIDLDCRVGSLVDVLMKARKILSQYPSRFYDWVDIPMDVDFEVGVNWRDMLEVTGFDPEKGKVRLKGDLVAWEKLEPRLRSHYDLRRVKVKDNGIVESAISKSPSGIPKGVKFTKVLDDYREVEVSFVLG